MSCEKEPEAIRIRNRFIPVERVTRRRMNRVTVCCAKKRVASTLSGDICCSRGL